MTVSDAELNTPTGNASKIRKLLEAGEGYADLYRTIVAGPSGQRASLWVGRVRYLPFGPDEFRIIDTRIGEAVGYARRVGDEWSVTYQCPATGELTWVGYASSLSVGVDVCRKPAQALMHSARKQGWDRVTVETALHELAEEIHRLKARVATVMVDRDRGIREALLRAEDCDKHGENLRHERHQANWFSHQANQLNEERVVWLSAAQSIRDEFAKRDDALAKKVVAYVDAAGRDAARVRKRYTAPSLADCQRAGHCEHPATVPHRACQQLAEAAERVDLIEAVT